ncbi:LysR substrate-binding domain-containing protein [Crenobacter sp. SG2303]|uniref:LysR substrate-binding domain-containing protein n=1 Tax=Crenobacter oryzisoli TaxID=3056844 RepID=A0ABT7XN06_9NEIS|nr:LysR substrate-binding domain-containing protein [Crenobacter sp. SG2303]MDN0075184.1 LysR substrate-binding domain-containing protein [Crenobacter sp. SG2303]
MSTFADQLEEMFLSDNVTCLSSKFAATLTGQDAELCSTALESSLLAVCCSATPPDEGIIRAAVQGVGLAQHMELAVRRQLEDGELVRVLQPWCRPFPGFYLYVPSREQMTSKVRALMYFLVEKRSVLAAQATKP